MEVMGAMGNARGTLRDRARGALSGLAFVGTLMLGVIGLNVLKSMVNDLPNMRFLNWGSDCVYLYSIESLMLLPALPLWVVAMNAAPRALVARIAWLAAATAAYAYVSAHMPTRWLFPKFDTSDVFDAALVTSICLVCGAFEVRRRASASASSLLRARIDAVAQEAELDRARLTLLRAQIEPHFLFNTLANVRRLAQIDRTAAAAMLGDLIDYFSATLARRDALTTLDEDARIIESYLRIHRVRMGERLGFEIAIPPALREARVPAMMLLTLVENAVKHGVNPLTTGGFIRVRAEQHADTLHLTVADSGRGMSASLGHGSGLANVRARLGLHYGARARLALAQGEPRGVIASIDLPVEFT